MQVSQLEVCTFYFVANVAGAGTALGWIKLPVGVEKPKVGQQVPWGIVSKRCIAHAGNAHIEERLHEPANILSARRLE